MSDKQAKKFWFGFLAIISAIMLLALPGCTSDAARVSENLSIEADNFNVQRMIVGINTFTDSVIFTVEGRCSIARDGDLVVTCKHGPDDYRKHYVGLSDNVTFVSTQIDGLDVSEYYTKIILKPQNVFVDYDLSVGEHE